MGLSFAKRCLRRDGSSRGSFVPASDRRLFGLTSTLTIQKIWQLPLETMALEAEFIAVPFHPKS